MISKPAPRVGYTYCAKKRRREKEERENPSTWGSISSRWRRRFRETKALFHPTGCVCCTQLLSVHYTCYTCARARLRQCLLRRIACYSYFSRKALSLSLSLSLSLYPSLALKDCIFTRKRISYCAAETLHVRRWSRTVVYKVVCKWTRGFQRWYDEFIVHDDAFKNILMREKSFCSCFLFSTGSFH